MRAYRIADRRFPIFDGGGARLAGGRWNSPGRPLVYAAETFAGAMLEVLAHGNLGRVPRTHAVIEIDIPDFVALERVSIEAVPGWNAEEPGASRRFGDQWLQELRTAVLVVPSVVTQGRENNVLLNPAHPQFKAISASQPKTIVWDERLFRN